MPLELTDWNIKDSLQDVESIFYFLEAVLDEPADASYDLWALQTVTEVRGGVKRLSLETGVEAERLTGAGDRETMTRVMEAFRPESEKASARVA